MEKFQVGDIVVCKPGYNKKNKNEAVEMNFGGAGYEEGRIAKIDKFSGNNNDIAWFSVFDAVGRMEGRGIYAQALRLAYKFEAEWYAAKKTLERKSILNISEMYTKDFKKMSVHYIDVNGEKTSAEVNEISDIKDLKEFLYKFDR